MKWILASDRLPGMNKVVKWRNGAGGNIPLGENTFLDQYKKVGANTSWHEWFDASPSPVQGVAAKDEDRGCPCKYLDEPCHPMCTCKIGGSSLGCMYCATYGNIEQRKQAAKRIAELIKAGSAWQPGERQSTAEKDARIKTLEDGLREISPILDELINATPTGSIRNKLCDLNIKVKTIIQ